MPDPEHIGEDRSGKSLENTLFELKCGFHSWVVRWLAGTGLRPEIQSQIPVCALLVGTTQKVSHGVCRARAVEPVTRVAFNAFLSVKDAKQNLKYCCRKTLEKPL